MAKNTTITSRQSKLRSCFVTWPHPEWIMTYKHNEDGTIKYDDTGKPEILSREPSAWNGLTPEEICKKAVQAWCAKGSGWSAAVTYCISPTQFEHCHCIFECPASTQFRYSSVQDLLGIKAHCEATRGNKDQALDYINKVGDYAEKGETVLAVYQSGEIKGNQGNRSDLDNIGKMISDGFTPKQILADNFKHYKYETMIRKAYYDKRNAETAIMREVKVIWHVGETGTGKTYGINNINPDDLYFVNDYQNGGFDTYNGEPVLWLDEYRGQFPYSTLLSYLDKYKVQVHARYTNALSLWTEVHITSSLYPDEIYAKMCADKHDKIDQLMRRITTITHHTKDDDGYHACDYSPASFASCLPMRDQVTALEKFPPKQPLSIDDGLPY